MAYNVIDRRHNKNLQKNQEDVAKPSRTDKFLILLLSFLVFFSISIVLYLAIIVPPRILNTELSSLPVNANSVYPILLQGLLIVASIVVGFFSFVLNRLISEPGNLVKKLKLSLYIKAALYIIILVLIIVLYSSLLLSIFYSINGMIYYGELNSYIIQTKAIQIPNLFKQDLPIVIMNNSYFNNSAYKNYTSPINQTHTYLLSNTKGSVENLFVGFAIVLILILFYALSSFEVFDLINNIWNKFGIWGKISLTALFLLVSYLILYFINPVYFILIMILSIFVLLVIIIIILEYNMRTNKKNKQNANPPI